MTIARTDLSNCNYSEKASALGIDPLPKLLIRQPRGTSPNNGINTV